MSFLLVFVVGGVSINIDERHITRGGFSVTNVYVQMLTLTSHHIYMNQRREGACSLILCFLSHISAFSPLLGSLPIH